MAKQTSPRFSSAVSELSFDSDAISSMSNMQVPLTGIRAIDDLRLAKVDVMPSPRNS